MSRPEKFSQIEELERVALANLGGRNRRVDFDLDEDAGHDHDHDDEAEEGSPVTDVHECELCQRAGLELTRHHLIPRSRHRKARSKRQFSREEMRSRIAHLCRDCHGQIHRLFTEKELAADFNTLENLKAHEGMRKFVAYIRKKH
jgi:hypothetical protein